MERKFAYLDKGGILHVSGSYDTAKNYSANGVVVETTVKAEHGYPVVNGEQIIVYNEETMKITADGDKLEPIPVLAMLYSQCK